jgi:hypothetical protein
MLAISVLLVALAITVAILATQWLGENASGSQSLPSIHSTISLSGGTT